MIRVATVFSGIGAAEQQYVEANSLFSTQSIITPNWNADPLPKGNLASNPLQSSIYTSLHIKTSFPTTNSQP